MSELALWQLWLLAAAVLSLAYCAYSVLIYRLRIRSFKSNFPLPPGPPGKFIIGNVTDMPKHRHWETISRWGEKYGGLVYLEVFGKPMVFINSYNVATELLEKRSAIYSDRFDFPMLNDLMGLDWGMPLMRYGDRWRQYRRIFHQEFNSNAVSKFQPTHIKQTHIFVRRLHETPHDYYEHIMHLATATIMEIVYGINVLPLNDPLVEIAQKALHLIATDGFPGTYLVDTLPVLKYVPEWVPGAGFKTKAREARVYLTKMVAVPFERSKTSFSSGDYPTSFTSSWLEKLSQNEDTLDVSQLETLVRNVGGVSYAGGFETTTFTLLDFFLAMILYPGVQRKAQEELDRVIGPDRVPDFSDRLDLPYINALVKELFRWRPVFPLGIPHRVMTDDVYNGFWIPKDSVVTVNVWGILRDEASYGSDTDAFRPERFLEPGVMEPLPAFGFGRRICPGRYMAENTIFMAVSTILHLFTIGKGRDGKGQEVPVTGTFTSGFIIHPEPFQCSIEPRANITDHLLNALSDE